MEKSTNVSKINIFERNEQNQMQREKKNYFSVKETSQSGNNDNFWIGRFPLDF